MRLRWRSLFYRTGSICCGAQDTHCNAVYYQRKKKTLVHKEKKKEFQKDFYMLHEERVRLSMMVTSSSPWVGSYCGYARSWGLIATSAVALAAVAVAAAAGAAGGAHAPSADSNSRVRGLRRLQSGVPTAFLQIRNRRHKRNNKKSLLRSISHCSIFAVNKNGSYIDLWINFPL